MRRGNVKCKTEMRQITWMCVWECENFKEKNEVAWRMKYVAWRMK